MDKEAIEMAAQAKPIIQTVGRCNWQTPLQLQVLTEAEQHNQLQCLHETNSSKQTQPVETLDKTCQVACRE